MSSTCKPQPTSCESEVVIRVMNQQGQLEPVSLGMRLRFERCDDLPTHSIAYVEEGSLAEQMGFSQGMELHSIHGRLTHELEHDILLEVFFLMETKNICMVVYEEIEEEEVKTYYEITAAVGFHDGNVGLLQQNKKEMTPDDIYKNVDVQVGPSTEICYIYHPKTQLNIKVQQDDLVASPLMKNDKHFEFRRVQWGGVENDHTRSRFQQSVNVFAFKSHQDADFFRFISAVRTDCPARLRKLDKLDSRDSVLKDEDYRFFYLETVGLHDCFESTRHPNYYLKYDHKKGCLELKEVPDKRKLLDLEDFHFRVLSKDQHPGGQPNEPNLPKTTML